MAALTAPVVLKRLRKIYHPPKTFLEYRTPLDLIVAVVLSAQCTDARVNLVTKTILYPKYRTAKDYVRVAREELEQDIKSCGFYRAKAKSIQGLCAMLLEKHGGKVPQTMAELVELPGVGRKTANVVQRAVFGKVEGIAVDTHVIRLSRRLGLSKHAEPEKIELDLMHALPKKDWPLITTHLITHGRTICTAFGRTCGACIFQKECPSSLLLHKSDLTAKKPVLSKRQEARDEGSRTMGRSDLAKAPKRKK